MATPTAPLTGNPILDDPDSGQQTFTHPTDNPIISDLEAGQSTKGVDAQPTSFLDRAWSSLAEIPHALALGTRDVAEGAASLPTAALDVATWPGRAIQRAAGIPTTAPSTMLQQGLDAAGLPTPQTPGERARSSFIQGAAATLPAMAVTAPASLAAAAGQGLMSGTGAVTGEAAAALPGIPEALKPSVRLAGNMLGAGGAGRLYSALDRASNLASGTTTDIAQAYDRLGMTPRTIGALSSNPTAQGAEAALSRMPGSAPVVQSAIQKTASDFGDAVDNTAGMLGTTATAQDAGRTVQAAARDWRYNTFPQMQTTAYAPVNQKMAGAYVDPSGYRSALQNAAVDPALAGMPATQQALQRDKLQDLLDALDKDAPPGKMMSWEQAQAVRKNIGDAMGTPDWVGSLGQNALKSVYGGIAGDLQNAATGAGVGTDFARANALSTTGHAFIDNVLSKAVSANNPLQESISPEAATNALLGSGDTSLQALRLLVPKAADELGAFKLRSMARAVPSQSGATGTEPSTNTYLTQFNQLRQRAPGSADALFGADPNVAQGTQDLASVAAQLRQTSQRLNTSNTAHTAWLMSLIPQLTAGYESGGIPGALAGPALSAGLPWVAGKAITNPLALRMARSVPGQQPMSSLLSGAIANVPAEERN